VTATINIGPLQPEHRRQIEEIVRATGVFSEAEIAVALELFDDAVKVRSDYEFVGAFEGERLIGYACFGATPATDRTYDLYWIAVHPSAQRGGTGASLMSEVERRLEGRRARLVLIETSSRDDYAPTRRFYHKRGYEEAARLRDFYAPGDDRVVLSKRMGSGDPGGSVAARPLPA
jgi:ribosomal protein S18 acetylase RimI-like enzyme